MTRQCGDCTLCCKLVPVVSLSKGAGEKCKHQSRKGCGIYPSRPQECRDWSCAWLSDEHALAYRLPRPDRVGYVIDVVPDEVIKTDLITGVKTKQEVLQVWVDVDRGDAWMDERLQNYMDHIARTQGMATLIRFNNAQAFAIYPPCISDTGNWIRTAPQATDPTVGRFSRQSPAHQKAALGIKNDL